jgi:hypothetical protein
MARSRPTLLQQYHLTLRKFMGRRDGALYGKDHVFTAEELAAVTPEQLVRWFRLISFGTETPGPDNRPTLRRSTTGIAFCKKAISYFMADGSAQWNSQAQSGNPTMSKAVNKLLAEIKKHEVWKQGKKSNAKRNMKGAAIHSPFTFATQGPRRD